MQLQAVRVFVHDLVAARGFYGVRLALPLKGDGLAQGWLVFDAGGGVDLVVEAVAPDAPEDDHALVGRFSGLSFRVADVAAAQAALQAAGVDFDGPPERQPWGGTLATLYDPAGNSLQLVQMPGARSGA